MIEGERRKPCHIFRFQSIAFDSKLLQNRIHVDRVPESEDVDYKSRRVAKKRKVQFRAVPEAQPSWTRKSM